MNVHHKVFIRPQLRNTYWTVRVAKGIKMLFIIYFIAGKTFEIYDTDLWL